VPFVSGTVSSRLSGTFAAASLIRGEHTVSELTGSAEFRGIDSETGIEAVQRGFEVCSEAGSVFVSETDV
jgi:fatty acid-binding protein DegV